MRFFLDTGVLLWLLDPADLHHATIRESVHAIRAHGHSFQSVARNIAEFWNVSTCPRSARGGFGQSIETTDRRVRFLEYFGSTLQDTAAANAIWRELVATHQVSGVAVNEARLARPANSLSKAYEGRNKPSTGPSL